MSTLREQILATLDGPRAAPAIQFKGHWSTWGDVADIVSGLDAACERLGLGAGTVVACVLRNRPEHAAAMIGVVGSGRCLLTLNGLAPDDKLAADVSSAAAAVVIAAAEDWRREPLRAAAKAAGAAGLSLTGDPRRPVAPVDIEYRVILDLVGNLTADATVGAYTASDFASSCLGL